MAFNVPVMTKKTNPSNGPLHPRLRRHPVRADRNEALAVAPKELPVDGHPRKRSLDDAARDLRARLHSEADRGDRNRPCDTQDGVSGPQLAAA
jgi:hypothetical protein